MKTKILAIVLALACLSASAAIIERTCVVSNQTYVVKYEYNEHGLFEVPATVSGQAHYSCKVTVFLQQYNIQQWGKKSLSQIGEPFDGTVTERGCFEDVPEQMVAQAWRNAKAPKVAPPVLVEENWTNVWQPITNYPLPRYMTNQFTITNWFSTTTITNEIVEGPLAKELKRYKKAWVGPDGREVTDAGLLRVLDLWETNQ